MSRCLPRLVFSADSASAVDAILVVVPHRSPSFLFFLSKRSEFRCIPTRA
jgi:hypothetical protein